MKVFLSWSGARSRAIAEVLKDWLPKVLQAVKPYFSPEDLSKGSRWAPEIATELEATRVALLIITPENQEAPWLIFEAGALSKNLDNSKVCPLLFGEIEPTDIKGPLVQFQSAQFNAKEMRQVLKAINSELGDLALTSDVLDNVFDMWWPTLEKEVDLQVKASVQSNTVPRRTERELIEEVLALARNLDSKNGKLFRESLPAAAFVELLHHAVELARALQKFAPGSQSYLPISRLRRSAVSLYNREKVAFADGSLEQLVDELKEVEALSFTQLIGPLESDKNTRSDIDIPF